MQKFSLTVYNTRKLLKFENQCKFKKKNLKKSLHAFYEEKFSYACILSTFSRDSETTEQVHLPFKAQNTPKGKVSLNQVTQMGQRKKKEKTKPTQL